jgi:hypothetical protein
MTCERFILRHLAFTGTKAPIARLDFSEHVSFVYGASNTGKSFALAAIDFMLGGSAKELPEIPQRDPYDTVWLGLTLPSGRSVTLSRAVKGGSFALQEGLNVVTIAGTPPLVLGDKHDAKRTDTLSHFLLSEIALTGKKIAKNKAGKTENFSFRQLAPFVLIDETSIQAPRSPIEAGQRDDTKDRAVFRLLLTGEDDSAIVASMTAPDFRTSKKAKITTIEELIAGLDKEIATSLDALGGTAPDADAVEMRLAEANEAWERARTSLRELLDVKRRLRSETSGLDTRRSDIRVHLDRFSQLDKVYVSDMARLEALEEAGFLLSLGADRDCPLCGAPHDVQRIEHGTEDIERQRTAALAEIAKIEGLRSDLRETVADLEREQEVAAAQIEVLNERLRRFESEIERASTPAAENETTMRALIGQRDAVTRHGQLVRQRQGLEQKRDEFGQLRQSRKDQPLLKTSDAALHEFCKIMSDVLKEWKFPGDCQVAFDETLFDVKIDGKARKSNGKGVRALTHAAFKLALLLYCRKEGLPHPGLIVLDSPLVAYRDPVKSKKGVLEDDEKLIAASSVRENFFRHLASLAHNTQFVVFDNIDPPTGIEALAKSELYTGAIDEGQYGFFPIGA